MHEDDVVYMPWVCNFCNETYIIEGVVTEMSDGMTCKIRVTGYHFPDQCPSSHLPNEMVVLYSSLSSTLKKAQRQLKEMARKRMDKYDDKTGTTRRTYIVGGVALACLITFYVLMFMGKIF